MSAKNGMSRKLDGENRSNDSRILKLKGDMRYVGCQVTLRALRRRRPKGPGLKPELKTWHKVAIISAMVVASCLLCIYYHVVLKSEVVYTHFFYVPIAIAAFWWGRKGIVVAALLAALILLTHAFSGASGSLFNDIGRAVMFIVVSVVVAELSEQTKKQRSQLVRDITARKQAEDELRHTRDYLENLLDYANAPVIVWDREFKITRFNHAFERLIGRSADEIVGGPLEILFPEDSCHESMTHIRRTMTGERWETVEIPVLRSDGNVRTVLWNSATLFEDDGETIVATIAQGQDITDRKLAEAEVRLHRDHLVELVGERTAELERSNAELQQFASFVSHDLKGPLSSVITATNLLAEVLEGEGGEAHGGDAGEALGIIRTNVERAFNLIDNLLTLARAGTSPGRPEPVDISGVVRYVLEQEEALLKDHGIRVSLDGDLGVSAIDPTHAYQVFSNLLGNAIKYNDSENPEVHISRLDETETGVLRYLVRDNGPGIPDGEEEDIFLPFHKGRDSSNTGLGLSIVDRVVRVYGGQIRAFNSGGACFEFTLPGQAR